MGDFADSTANTQTGLDLAAQTGQSIQNGLDGASQLSKEIPLNGASSSGGAGVLGGLGVLSGGLTIGKGIEEISEGKTGAGAFDVLSGGASVVQGATSALTPLAAEGSSLAGALGPVGGAAGAFAGGLQMGKGVAEIQNGQGADAAFDLLQGGANATAGVATMVGAAPVAAVAGAGALGMSAGKAMGDAADSKYTKTGFWGQDENTGQNKSAMDWGAGWGQSYDKWAGNKEPSIMGGIAAGAGGIVGGVAGAGQALWNWATN